MTRNLPSLRLLRQLLDYDAETGKLYWRTRDRALFSDDRQWRTWNIRFAGKEAGGHSDGYLLVRIFGISHSAHRVAWTLHHGRWPKQQIDHLNGDPADNRIANLRDCSRSTNLRNSRMASTNTSGVNGVCRVEDRWRAYITVGGKHVHLGRFGTIEEAAAARAAANAAHGYTDRHGL